MNQHGSDLSSRIIAVGADLAYSICPYDIVNEKIRLKIHRALSSIDHAESLNPRFAENIIHRCFEKVSAVKKELKTVIWASLVLVSLYYSGRAPEHPATAEQFFDFFDEKVPRSSYAAVDPLFLAFVNWMRLSQSILSPNNNQGNLLLICAYLETVHLTSVERNGAQVLDYSTGSGKTDAVKRRLLAYHWFAAHYVPGDVDPEHAKKADKYIEELVKSLAKGETRRRTGNQVLVVELEQSDFDSLSNLPSDFYDLVYQSTNLNAHAVVLYYLDQNEQLSDLYKTLAICFSDIPYFNTIMKPPVARLMYELVMWFGTPRLRETLPDEMKILDQYIKIDGKGEEKMKIVMAMMACKVMVMQKASKDLNCQWAGFPILDMTKFDTSDLTTPAALKSEFTALTHFIEAVVLTNQLCTSERLRNKQIILFEIGQRLEGTGRVYSKGGGEGPATKRRLKIIADITGRARPSRAAAPAVSNAITASPAPVPQTPLAAPPPAVVQESEVSVEEALALLNGLSLTLPEEAIQALDVVQTGDLSAWMIETSTRQSTIQSNTAMSVDGLISGDHGIISEEWWA